jgi:GNAT superfamily N-acetyltransferase
MLSIRSWHRSDLPYLLEMSAQLEWSVTPESDRARSSSEVVARRAQTSVLELLQAPSGTAFIAESEGRPVGYILAGPQCNERTGEWHGYMAEIYVTPQFRRKKVGKALVETAEAYFRRLGLRKVRTWVHAHNPLGSAASTEYGQRVHTVLLAKRL